MGFLSPNIGFYGKILTPKTDLMMKFFVTFPKEKGGGRGKGGQRT